MPSQETPYEAHPVKPASLSDRGRSRVRDLRGLWIGHPSLSSSSQQAAGGNVPHSDAVEKLTKSWRAASLPPPVHGLQIPVGDKRLQLVLAAPEQSFGLALSADIDRVDRRALAAGPWFVALARTERVKAASTAELGRFLLGIYHQALLHRHLAEG